MPRRNLLVIIVVIALSLVCYQNVQHSRYGRILVDSMKLIEQRYVKPVASQELFEGAMEGMVDRLGDPHSSYISPADLETFTSIIDQEFGGVGIEVTLDPDTKQLIVGRPFVGSPAYRAGVRAGDKILAVNGTSIKGMALEDTVKLMRGKLGEAVVLRLLHEGETEPVDLKIVREKIHVDTVLGDLHNPDGSWNFFLDGEDRIGYLRINNFGKDTSDELQAALAWLKDHDMRALVLDLRDNPGGLLDAAVDICDLFVAKGDIVTTRGRNADQIQQRYRATGAAEYVNFPMAVLVNRNSASASEIVAACLQDHGRAVVVGERTYGKGTVQEVVELMDHCGALRLTTASYWRPSGKNINRPHTAQKPEPQADEADDGEPEKGAEEKGKKTGDEEQEWGVTPNAGYEVLVKGKDRAKLLKERLSRDLKKQNGEPLEALSDPQLNKALDYLRHAIAAPAAPAQP